MINIASGVRGADAQTDLQIQTLSGESQTRESDLLLSLSYLLFYLTLEIACVCPLPRPRGQ